LINPLGGTSPLRTKPAEYAGFVASVVSHATQTQNGGRFASRPPFRCLLVDGAFAWGWTTSSSRPSLRLSWLLSSLPFAYSPYRLNIDAAASFTAANEGIVLMKFSVKKNRIG
jgi:hypothetical protein